MPALWLIAVGQNQYTAVFGVCSDTYGFLLCIQTSVGWCAKHCITLNSKMHALWLAAVGQNHKTAVLVSAVTPMCLLYIPQWGGVPALHHSIQQNACLWLSAVEQNQYTAVLVSAVTPMGSAVHTDLSGLVCQALHHSKQQNACPVAGCCWAEPIHSSFWCLQ